MVRMGQDRRVAWFGEAKGRCEMSNKKGPKAGYTICGDCGAEYKTGYSHVMFCPAHTCDECGSSFSHVVQDCPDEKGKRICEDCLEKYSTGA